jgi:NAD(P)-dependent dehydrogenase (short-subunit alcohol dehydrogenase family)
MELKTKTFIITGGNSGLGYQCAKSIALGNERNYVVVASRNMEKSCMAAEALRAATDNPHIYALPLNLASLQSVREFCSELSKQNFPPLYGLVCNAIAGASAGAERTGDGFEHTFGVGHLGHFLLANILLKTMQDGGRIVFVSSDQHNPPKWIARLSYTDALEFAYPQKKNHSLSYSATKLCNIYCAHEMAARIKSDTAKNITVNTFNPGFMADTGLGKTKNVGERIAKCIAPLLARLLGTHSSAVKSGKLLANLMTDNRFDDFSGRYFDRGEETSSSALSYNKANAVNLWQRSIELVNLQKDETVFAL